MGHTAREQVMESEEALTKQLTALLEAQGDWPAAVTRIAVRRMVDSVGDDALSIEVFLIDDNATDERIDALVDFDEAVSLAVRELEPGPFAYVSMVVEPQPYDAGARR